MARPPGRPKVDFNEDQRKLLAEYLKWGPGIKETALKMGVSDNTLSAFIKREYGMSFPEYKIKCMSGVLQASRQRMLKKGIEEGDFKALLYILDRWDKDEDSAYANQFPYAPPPSMHNKEDSDGQDDDK